MNVIGLTDLVIDTKGTVGDTFILRGAYPTYAYKDGAPTTIRDGTRYRVATSAGMLNVKVKGSQTIDFDTDSAPVTVRFADLMLYVYFGKDGKPSVGGRAKAVQVMGEDT